MPECYVVTGAAGFIGRHLVRGLAAGGCQVIGLDRLWDSQQDLTSPMGQQVLARSIEEADGIYHLAGTANWRDLEERPERAVRELEMHHAVISLAAEHRKPLVVASSAYALGHQAGFTPTIYGWLKDGVERLALAYAHRGANVSPCRIYNVYGPGQEQAVTYHSALVPDLVRKLEQGPLEVRDSRATRDFIYVTDVCRGLVFALEHQRQHRIHQETGSYCGYELGTGVPTTVGAVAELISEYREAPAPTLDETGDPTSPADQSGWPPGFRPETNLEQGLRQTIEEFSYAARN